MIIFQNNIPVSVSTSEEFERFARQYRLIHAAGGIVQNEDNEILMIFRLEKWDFPKGKVEAGEEYAEAAVREVEEETGLHDLRLGERICITHHTYILRGEKILKHTYWYRMYDEAEETLLPQAEEDITGAQWVEKKCLPDYLESTYPSIAEVFVTAGLL